MKTKYLVTLLFFGLALAGCSDQAEKGSDDKSQPAAQAAATELPDNHPPMAMAQTTQQDQPSESGIIKEILVGGGYTYAAVDMSDQLVWVAGPSMQLEVGDQVGWKNGSMIENFTSSSLNRTFDKIYFISAFIKSQPVVISKGLVEEAISSAGYVYIRVNVGNKSVWLAVPDTDVKNGETISWNAGAVMRNFKSNSLDRIFEEVIFVDNVTKG